MAWFDSRYTLLVLANDAKPEIIIVIFMLIRMSARTEFYLLRFH